MVKTLLVEDDINDATLTVRSLHGEDIELHIARNREELAALLVQPFDVCLMDMALSNLSGEEAIQLVKASQPGIPIIIYSGSVSTDQVATIIRTKIVIDYLNKRDHPLLSEKIKRAHEENLKNLALERAERMNNLGQLATGIVHDWSNCLQPAFLFFEIVRPTLVPEHKRHMEVAYKALERGKALQSQLMIFLRGTETVFKSINLGMLLRNMMDSISGTFPARMVLKTDLPLDLPEINGNETQLFQVFMNLAVNARDAMKGAGVLSISLRMVNLNNFPISLRETLNGNWMIAEVSDDGPGMQPGVAAHCWDPFFTTKPLGMGTGLGLHIVKGLIQAHRGHATLRTAPGQGATFSIYLPVGERKKETGGDTSLLPSNGKGRVVLLVDDETSILDITKTVLELSGWRVITATNGAEAAIQLKEQKDKIVAALVDYQMPFMSGVEVMKELSKIKPDLPMMFMSGRDVGRIEAGDLKFKTIQKPFTAQTILQELENLVR